MQWTDLTEITLAHIARQLAMLLRPGDILCLSGPLGAGKTTFARHLLYGLGLSEIEEVPSPTFTLLNSYRPPDVRLPTAHVDLYRLSSAREVQQLGLEELLDDHLLIIEWPERWGDDLPAAHLHVQLSGIDAYRTILLTGPEHWMTRLQPLKVLS
jgi:tRNA threonylcarbamoyl adenosine modification protein YjeE